METTFTPLTSLIGGALIGLSAVLLLASHGRIAGISGILVRLLPAAAQNSNDGSGPRQSLIFVLGLLLAAPLWWLATGSAPAQTIAASAPVLIIAGLLAGFGSVLGNGCTSGHGVCGISRASPRSIVATMTFMVAAILTVTLTRHVF